MKYTITFIFLLFFGRVFCQTSGYDQIVLNQDYSEVQRNLYSSSNSSDELRTQQNKSFQLLYSFIGKYSKSENALYLLAEAVNLTSNQFDSLYYLLDTSLNNSPYKAYVIYARKRLQVVETGKEFPALNLTDTSGNVTSTGNFKGKITLIDIWSSWCSTCRKQIPDLIKLNSNYHQKGFNIIGVSVDENKQAWLDAVRKDKQGWKQYCELIPWRQNSLIRYFSILGIPVNFLLDRNGIVIGQDLSPEQIEAVISKL